MRFSSLCRRLLPALAVVLVLALPGVARAEAPHLMSNPTITGGATPPAVGDVLTGHNGGWVCNPGPCTKTTFQWFRCLASSASGCVPVTDVSTEQTYTVSPDDAGFSLVVQVVTWNYDCNATGTECHDSGTTASSPPTGPVTGGLTISPATLPNPTHGLAYSQTFSTTLSGTWSVSAGALPPGLALSNAGALTGTPTAVGSFTFTVKVVAPKSGGTKQYTLVVSHPVLAIAPQQLFAATPGIFYSQPISASGGAAPYTFALTSGTLPAGLLFGYDGTLSGRANDAPGLYTFTVQTTDVNGATGTRTYTLQLATPTIYVTSLALQAATVGSAYLQSLIVAGGNAPYTFALADGALPVGIALSSDGVLSGTPTAAGTYLFTVKITDAMGTATTQSFRLVVEKPPPTITKKKPALKKKKPKSRRH